MSTELGKENFVKLPVDKVRTDGGTQPRAEMNEETILDYAQQMEIGTTFPPVIVFYDGSDYWLADGFHRYHAHQHLGRDTIDAEIRQGTRRDAVLFSVGANASHGLRRTNADKHRAVETLLRDEEWSNWSDREIARRCNLTHPTVSAIRAKFSLENFTSEENDSYAPQIKNYITKHGTVATMNTSHIMHTQHVLSTPTEVKQAISQQISTLRHELEKLEVQEREQQVQEWQERQERKIEIPPLPFQELAHQELMQERTYPHLSEHEAELSGYRGQEKWEKAWEREHKDANKVPEPERVHGLSSERAYCPECDEWHRDWEYPYGGKEGVWTCEECGTEIHSSEVDIKGPTEREKYETARDLGTLDYYYKDLVRGAIAREEDEEEEGTNAKKEQRDAHVMQVMGSSDSPEWYTPPGIVGKVLELMGTIELDPCSNSHENPKVPATILYTKDDDGLSLPWVGKTYLNPPYGTEISKWVNRLIDAYKSKNVDEAVALLPGRIDTNWFSPLYEYLICIIKGRVQFENSPYHAPFPCVLIYLGERRDEFTKVFSSLGPIVERIS